MREIESSYLPQKIRLSHFRRCLIATQWTKHRLYRPIQKPVITLCIQLLRVQYLLQFPGMDSGSIAGK